MKVLLLAGANSIHTSRWANGLATAGLDVHVASMYPARATLDTRVVMHRLGWRPPWGYLLAVRAVKRLVDEIRPDIINAHYASGYGTLARLSGVRPLMLSVWGSDIYDFPRVRRFNKWLIRKNIEHANSIGSTSRAMAVETRCHGRPKRLFITPFGVDPEVFKPSELPHMRDAKRAITIGTVKRLMPKYGIDTLIEAFALLRSQLERDGSGEFAYPLRLLIVGDGCQRRELEDLAKRLGVEEFTEFRGAVPHSAVPKTLHELDIYVALSRYDSESFGVAVLEASACGLPVVVSDADGPKEVTEHNSTGFVVPRNDPVAAAEALRRLIGDPSLRTRLGENGRRHVLDNYTWEASIASMLKAYEQTISDLSDGSLPVCRRVLD